MDHLSYGVVVGWMLSGTRYAAKLIGPADLQELAPPSGESGAALLRLRVGAALGVASGLDGEGFRSPATTGAWVS